MKNIFLPALWTFLIACSLSAQDFRAEFRSLQQTRLQQKGMDPFDVYERTAAAINAVKPPPVNADSQKNTAEQNAFQDVRSTTFVSLLCQMIRYDADFSFREFQRLRKDGKILPKHITRFTPQLAQHAARNGNRPLWEILWKEFTALPKEQRNLYVVSAFLQSFTPDKAWNMAAEYLSANPDLNGIERFNILSGLVTGRVYNGEYSWAKKKLPELEQLATTTKNASLKSLYHALANGGFKNADTAFAQNMAEKGDNRQVLLYLKLKSIENDFTGCAAILEEAIKNWNVHDKPFILQMQAAAFIYRYKGNIDAFDRVFEERKFNPQQRLSFLRNGCVILRNLRHYKLIQTVDREICEKWFIPRQDRFYDVKYTDLAPATAGAWATSPFYNDWKAMEQRFFRYDDQYMVSEHNDTLHLKGIEQKPLNPDYRTGVHFLADVTGLHIYIRGNDPAMQEVFESKRDAGAMECYFKPGYDAPYSMWFCHELPRCTDNFEVDFAAPSAAYTLTADCIKRDAVCTKEAIVVHTLIPWYAFLKYLPLNNGLWYFGMQRWCADSRTLSGHVHELERMVRLRFQFTPQQKVRLLRAVCRETFNRYSTLRNDRNGSILLWKQPDVGDPEFYEKALLPLLNELDQAGNSIQSASDEQLLKLAETYPARWHGILYEIDRIRAEWLKQSLMK